MEGDAAKRINYSSQPAQQLPEKGNVIVNPEHQNYVHVQLTADARLTFNGACTSNGAGELTCD